MTVPMFDVFFGAHMRRNGPSLVSTFGPNESGDVPIIATELEYGEAITTIEFKILKQEPIF